MMGTGNRPRLSCHPRNQRAPTAVRCAVVTDALTSISRRSPMSSRCRPTIKRIEPEASPYRQGGPLNRYPGLKLSQVHFGKDLGVREVVHQAPAKTISRLGHCNRTVDPLDEKERSQLNMGQAKAVRGERALVPGAATDCA
jgi:hypothetical protein